MGGDLYVDDVKVLEIDDFGDDLNAPNMSQPGHEFFSSSELLELDVQQILPMGSWAIDALTEAQRDHRRADLTMVVHGRVAIVSGRISKLRFSATADTNTIQCNLSFSGGGPDWLHSSFAELRSADLEFEYSHNGWIQPTFLQASPASLSTRIAIWYRERSRAEVVVFVRVPDANALDMCVVLWDHIAQEHPSAFELIAYVRTGHHDRPCWTWTPLKEAPKRRARPRRDAA